MSRAASSDTPAGTPSTMTVSCGPCDSPAVRNRSICGGLYWRTPIHPLALSSGPSIRPRRVRGWRRHWVRMVQAVDTRAAALEHLRIARLLDAQGEVIAAICAYSEV